MKRLILFPFAFLKGDQGCLARILSLASWIVIAPCLFVCATLPFATEKAKEENEKKLAQERTSTAVFLLTNSPTPSDTPTDTPTTTDTPTPSDTPTASDTPRDTDTPTITRTPTETRTPSITPLPFTPISRTSRYINTTTLNIRSGPSADYDVIGTLEFQDIVAVIGEQGDWYKISYKEEKEAWISRALTSENRPSASSGGGSGATRVPGATSAATIPPAAVCDCFSGDTLNCTSFSTQRQAQACFDYCMQQVGRDVHGLDGGSNPDGVACESLP